MQVMSNGRVRRSETEWGEVISRWQMSGLKPAQFCRRERIQLSSFLRWRRKGRPASAASEFVAVTTPPPASSSWALEISL
jgi:hypothetical protein